MDRVMVNITWTCNLTNCPYCWVNQVVRPNKELMDSPDRPAEDWIDALNAIGDPACFDFVGGEPFVFPKFVSLLENLNPRHRYAITTNLHAWNTIKEWLENKKALSKCVHFTASWHPSGKLSREEFAARLNTVRLIYPNLSVNIIDHASMKAKKEGDFFRAHEFNVHVSPYEHPADIKFSDRAVLSCNAGLTHYVINNDGYVWPCLTCFRIPERRSTRLGNIFDLSFKKDKERRRCRLRCEMFYVVDKSNSMIKELDIKFEDGETK